MEILKASAIGGLVKTLLCRSTEINPNIHNATKTRGLNNKSMLTKLTLTKEAYILTVYI